MVADEGEQISKPRRGREGEERTRRDLGHSDGAAERRHEETS